MYRPRRRAAFVDRVASAGLRLEALWTHFAQLRGGRDDHAGAARDASWRSSEDVRAAGHAPALLHAANSGAAMLYPETHLDLVRAGIAIYGLEPGPGVADGLGLRPALTWRSRVA